MVSDYVVALQMFRKAIWPSEKEIAESYVNEYLNEVRNYVDFPVRLNLGGEEKIMVYDNWYLAVERLREEVIKVYKRDNPRYIGDYVRKYRPSIVLDHRIVKDWEVTGVCKFWIASKMAEIWMRDVRNVYDWERAEMKQFVIDTLYYVVTIEE